MGAAGKHSSLLTKYPRERPQFVSLSSLSTSQLPFLQGPVERGILPIVLKSNTMLKAEYLKDVG